MRKGKLFWEAHWEALSSLRIRKIDCDGTNNTPATNSTTCC